MVEFFHYQVLEWLSHDLQYLAHNQLLLQPLRLPPPPPAAPPLVQPIIVQPPQQPAVWKIERDTIEHLIKQTSIVDGSVPAHVRRWFQEIDLTIPLTVNFQTLGVTIQIAARTVTGQMRIDIEHWIAQFMQLNAVNRDNVPWVNLRDYLRPKYLSANEPETLRREVESMRQSALEDLSSYARRAEYISTLAFPPPRHAEQHRLMTRAFIKGLSNKSVAEEVWRLQPADLAAAIQFSLQEASIRDDFNQLDIKSEVPFIKLPVTPLPNTNFTSVKPDPDPIVVSLNKQIQNLTTKLAKLEAKVQQPPATNVPNSSVNRQYNSRPQTTCYYCGKIGHIQPNCWQRNRDQNSAPRDGPKQTTQRYPYRVSAPSPQNRSMRQPFFPPQHSSTVRRQQTQYIGQYQPNQGN